MASAGIRAELTCSICMEIYKDPTNLPCGHCFCWLCISKTWKYQIEGEYTCPECMKRYRRRPSLKRNLKLQNIADAYNIIYKKSEDTGNRCSYCIFSYVPAVKSCLHCDASLCDTHLAIHSKAPEHVMVEPTLVYKKCPIHKKILEYYCMEESSCICVICKSNRKHQGHQVVPLTKAFEQKLKKCRTIQKKLAKNCDKTERRLQGLQKEKERVTKKAAKETERVTALFNDLRSHLEDLEKRVLQVISGWEEKASLPVLNMIQELETKRDELSKRASHIEILCNMNDPVKVLQEKESGQKNFAEVDKENKTNKDRLLDVAELDEILISLEIHRYLADIMKDVKKRLHD